MRRADEAPEPSINVDVDNKYIVTLVDLQEGPSQWADAKADDVSLTWKFSLADAATGEPVFDDRSGDTYELWQFSNDKTYRNAKTGKAAKAREWAEALIGRQLTDDEVNDLIDLGFADALKGKKAVADLEWYTNKQGYERLKVIRLRPYRKPAAAPAATPAQQQHATYDADGEEREPVGAAAATLPGPPTPSESIADKRRRLGLDA